MKTFRIIKAVGLVYLASSVTQHFVSAEITGLDATLPGFEWTPPKSPRKFEGPDVAWSRPMGLIERPGEIPDDDEIWVYCNRYSYDIGDTVKLKVHTTAATYDIDIIRDGNKPRTVYSKQNLTGVQQETPEYAFARGCNWKTTLNITLDRTWEPAFYLVIVRIQEATGRPKEREGFFIVKSSQRHGKESQNTTEEDNADLVLIHTTSTLNAYNDWGGANHYRGIPDGYLNDIASYVVSTQRPISRGHLRIPRNAPRQSTGDYAYQVPRGWSPRYMNYEYAWYFRYSRHYADAGWASYERPFTVWAEREGYRVHHLTQADLHAEPNALNGYSTAVIVGHDEYWSWEMRDTLDNYVDAGGNLARFAGDFLWQVRLDDKLEAQWCYRTVDADPTANQSRVTSSWDTVGRPAALTMGLTGITGVYARYGVAPPRSHGGFQVYRDKHWALNETDLYYGDVFGMNPINICAFEVDGVDYTFRGGLPFPTGTDAAPLDMDIIAMCLAVRVEEDRYGGMEPIGSGALSGSALNSEPLYGSGMVVNFKRGKGEIFNAEQLAGTFNKTFLWWINAIIIKGNKFILTEDNLPSIDQKLSSELLRRRALQAWDQRPKPETRTTLPSALARSLLSAFLAPVLPRLALIAFRYAQPVLISTAIRYIGQPSIEVSASGLSIIALAAVVYIGLALSSVLYYHRLNRLKVMTRGAVVGLINNKLLMQHSTGYDDARAVTLMSTDAENVGHSGRMFHETWAQVVEVVIGTVMLARQVGWACVVPFVMIFFCSRMSRYLAKNLQWKQKDWNEATQKRLAMTASMVSSMKSLKMLGVTNYTESLVRDLRMKELDMAKRVRWMMVFSNASANALGIFSPVLTLVVFVVIATFNHSRLDTETAFTTTALLGLVTHPANMIMSIIPQAIGSLAAFERIQEYLVQPPRVDQRVVLKKTQEEPTEATPALCLQGVTIQQSTSASPILTDINLTIQTGSIVMCSGPVGSGKSILAKTLIGEFRVASGTVSVSSKRIAYCDQSAWLPSGTLQEAICGFMPEDTDWFDEVTRLCCLDEDLAELPLGSQTQVGSRGSNLSGGQRQRVALARALYSRCEIVVLDDTFSALDGKTEQKIVANLFGSEGVFRNAKSTVFVIARSAQFSKLADSLILLDGGSITYQGTWDDLSKTPDISRKFQADKSHDTDIEDNAKVDKTVQSQSLKVAEAVSDLSRATGDFSLYGYYMKAVSMRNFMLLLACTASYSFFVTFPQYWLQKWTEAPESKTWFFVGGYLISTFLAWTATNGSMWSTWILVAPRSGAELHRRLLSTVIGAPLSFFSNTDTGVILNRFSQDIQLVDRQLPPAILSISNQVFKLTVQLVLLFSAQKLMTMTLPLCVVIVYIVQKAYLRTSRQLRFLDLESRSAVYSSFLESVEGLVTIRSFGWEKQAENANIMCLDRSQQPSYILLCLQQWLCVVLDLMIAALATGIIGLAVVVKGTTTAGQIGMALNVVLVANSTLLSLVSSWTNLEISLGAMYEFPLPTFPTLLMRSRSRLKSLENDTPREEQPKEDYEPDHPWPSSGTVELNNVTAAYNDEAVALRNVSLKTLAGQQLIICGRTGSGKSTVMLTLLRLLDLKSGTISVDGVNLGLVPRSLVRQKCFITVSQDPFIFGQASLRFNLDPSESLSDEAIIEALRRTDLWSHFKSGRSELSPVEASQILDTSIASLAQMSTGQTQLFALTRALLKLHQLSTRSISPETPSTGRRAMPVLLLDEATASLDPETESVMHKIIRDEFTDKGHTVIAITHRLSGVADSLRQQDAVAILSQGRVEKVGPVQDVLGKTG
ncbi:hypothetical protein CkaCkLH20_07264 [Colletotrichum karsti]|uniref:ABC transporter n=1 Tax=Colletotrichum karsti TaxID=1095194 RepID=A0A9P6LGP5_9PEZI|nr:uncharacterized protein CkaCkLH20_07264 [Colletotrichum karsti]KAF9875444.1 hypothetical protein CkaCkLH20_07264 [Colletotrichum karsti]